VLEILKRMAARNFAGGLRQNEKVAILTWIVGISELIQAEINEEKREVEQRTGWVWRTGDWTGRERERELAFIKSFIENPNDVPEWTKPESTSQPSPFLTYFASGLELVKLHNILVAKSARAFEIIKTYHADTTKLYRRAENLRFWNKAAELRWDIHLKWDIMGVATLADAKDDNAAKEQIWRSFDEALLKWCGGVREELCREWAEPETRRSSPKLRVEDETTTATPAATARAPAAARAPAEEPKLVEEPKPVADHRPVERVSSVVEEGSASGEEKRLVVEKVPIEQPVVVNVPEIQEFSAVDPPIVEEMSVW
jgi:hypothetical protein